MPKVFHPSIDFIAAILTSIPQGLDSTSTALALAWVAKNRNTSTVILGVSSAKQLLENLKALEVLPKLTDDIMEQIETILNNKPAIEVISPL